MLSKEEIKHILDVNVDILTYKADKDFRCLTSTEKALLENNEKVKEYIEQLEKELETYKDIKSIANTKMTELTQIKDIDKLKSENWILQNKLNKYESKEKKLIEKLEEESNIHNENWKGVEIEKHSKEILEMLKKE